MRVDFLKKFFGVGNRDSAKEAKERLRIVLIHDRTDISPQLLENLRIEMIGVLTKYMDIDESKIELDLDREDQAVALVANIPVLRIKRGGLASSEGPEPKSERPERPERSERPERPELDKHLRKRRR